MYQVIVYDNSGTVPRVMHKESFVNEDCAWAWYDTKEQEKNMRNKPIKLEFKYQGNSDISN
jgi:hypothetical protein